MKMNELDLNVSELGIKEGTIFRNYRIMCEKIGIIPEVRGNVRKSQEQEIRRFFDYEKIEGTQKLYVTEVYDEPLTREDRRKTDESKQIYIKDQEVIMMYIANSIAKDVSSNKDINDNDLGAIVWDITLRDYWRTVGMINSNFEKMNLDDLNQEYFKCNSELSILNSLNCLDDKYKITIKSLNDFYARTNSKLSKIMNSALKNLSSRSVVMVSKEFKIIKCNDCGEYEYLDADDLDKSRILEAKRQAMTSMGYSNEGDIYIRGLKDKYYKKINNILYNNYEWNSVYEYYHIVFSRKNVLLEISDLEKEQSRYSLNDKVFKYLYNSIDKTVNSRKDRTMAEYNNYVSEQNVLGNKPISFFDYVRENNIYIYNDDYVEQQKFLTNKMIKL